MDRHTAAGQSTRKQLPTQQTGTDGSRRRTCLTEDGTLHRIGGRCALLSVHHLLQLHALPAHTASVSACSVPPSLPLQMSYGFLNQP
eukprot:2290659-Rhodomonas_salina.1